MIIEEQDCYVEEEERTEQHAYGDITDVYNNIKLDSIEACDREEAPVSTPQGVDVSKNKRNSSDNNLLRYQEKILLAPRRNEMFPMTVIEGKAEPVSDQTCKANKRQCIQPSVIVTPAGFANSTI